MGGVMDETERIEAAADEAYLRLERPSGMGLAVHVSMAQGEKCPRCWHYHTVRDNHDSLCDRCCLAVLEGWPNHESVPHIKAARAKQAAKYSAVTTAPPEGGAEGRSDPTDLHGSSGHSAAYRVGHAPRVSEH